MVRGELGGSIVWRHRQRPDLSLYRGRSRTVVIQSLVQLWIHISTSLCPSERCSLSALHLAFHILPTSRSRKPKKIRHLRDSLQSLSWCCAAEKDFSKEFFKAATFRAKYQGRCLGGSLLPSIAEPGDHIGPER